MAERPGSEGRRLPASAPSVSGAPSGGAAPPPSGLASPAAGSSGAAGPGAPGTPASPPASAAPSSGVVSALASTGTSAALDVAVLEELVAQTAREVEGAADPKIRADLCVRLALLFSDLLDDPDAAVRYAELAGADHPLGARVLLAQALSDADAGGFERAEDAIREARIPSAARHALLRDLAEGWLYRVGDAERAARVLRQVASEVPDRDVRELLALSLALSGAWSELATFLVTPAPAKGRGAAPSPAALAEAAHVLADRLGDTGEAVKLLERAHGGDADPLPLEHLLEIAGSEEVGLDGAALYQRRLELVGNDPAARPERLATTYLLALELLRKGQAGDAAALLLLLSSDANTAWGPRLALLTRRRIATLRAAWDEAAAIGRELAASAPNPALAFAYLRRAAQIYDARVGDEARALEIYAELAAVSPSDERIAAALERLRLLRGDYAALVAQLEAAARSRPDLKSACLRRAAAIAETRLGDLDAAIRLRREALGSEQDLAGHEDLARLYRKARDRMRLSQAYRKVAQHVGDERAASAWLCAAGSIDLALGHVREAEEAFREATRKAPKDVYSRAALALLFRRGSRWRELSDLLRELAPLYGSDGLRAAALRELGRVTATKLGDPKGARAYLEQALQLSPHDAGTLHALAELWGDAGDWAQAVALRERAVEASGESVRAAAILLEIGDIEERHRKNDEAARRAYERALEIDDRSIEALRALAQLHRKQKRYAELLSVLRRELELTEDPQRRLTLYLEIARHADQTEGDAEAAIEGYRAALAIDPANTPALSGLERICRRDGRWEVLAEAFAGAPRTVRNLRTLADALERLERWSELAEIRRAELELTEDHREGARASFALAQLYEEKLGDVDEAARWYRRAFELDGSDVRPLRALAHLYEAHGRFAELVETLERELQTIPASEAARKLPLLMRIGEIRRDRLDRWVEAAHAFEAILEIDEKDLGALLALEAIYTRLSREGDLLRILERKALAIEDKASRAQLLLQSAEIREKRGEVDVAIDLLRQAFSADPSNRTIFTALERLCYKRERWRDVMELYDRAIALVENKESRAYRLGDLYARRGQIQLQYLGQPGEAAASYLRVIELDPDNDTSLKFLESIFSQQGDWVGLLQAYEKRADLTSDDDKRLETLRRAARVAAAKQKDAAEAARLYERMLEVDPADAEALDALERYYEKSRDWDKLVSVLTLRLATAGGGDAAIALLTRIAQICEEGLRDENRAIDHYRRILEIAPSNKDALDALARIYESTERWTDFVDVTRRQIRVITDRNVKALLYFKCGSVMESKFGKEEDAIRYYDAAIKTSPSCLPAVHGLRDLYRRRADWPRVIQTLELEVKLWQDDKERAGVFAQIGQIYGEHLHDAERALHYYESALAVDPECLPANRALFELHYERGDWERAWPLAQALAQKAMREGEPAQRSEFYRKRGVTARHSGELRTAAESLIIALEIKPDHLQALDDLAALARAEPDCYDFPTTFRELEKIYRKQDGAAAHLARVIVAQAGLVERSGDLDTAERMYGEALALVPQDFMVLEALVELHAKMRRWTHAADAIVKFLERKPPPDKEVRIRALLRLAEIHGDGEMDALRAANALREVLRLDPQHQEAHYRLAQELFVAGRFAEAKQQIEKVIELAAAPGQPLSPEALARYYYYLGRILDQMGEHRSANVQYRRAAEYDPGYAPPALALARRSAQQGDRRAAENLLIQAAHAAMERGGPRAAVALQRGLARILLAGGERVAAIEAYRGILAVEPDGAEDRVALAEIYAMEDLPKAVQELHRVLDRDLRHAPAYRLLASLYERMGEPERAIRVNSILEILGYSDPGERAALAQARARHAFAARRGTLRDELRAALLLPPAARSVLGEVFLAVAEQVVSLYLVPPAGTNLVPYQHIDDPAFKVAVSDNMRLFGVEPEVYVGDEVYGGMIVLLFPRPIVTLSRELLDRPDAERRFLLGRAFDSIRGGYAPLMRLGPRERAEVCGLLLALMLPEAERPAQAREFTARLPRRVAKGLERFVGMGAAIDLAAAEAWVAGLAQAQDRAGLLACDDFVAAARILARLNGEDLAISDEGAVALGAVPGGVELVRYYLSDDYHRLRQALAEPMPRP